MQPVYVRVSAFNGVFGSGEGGYSRPAAGANASYSAAACDAYPTHCSLIPADQLLWSPVAPTVSLSALQVRPYLDPLLGPYLDPLLGPYVAPI